MIIYIVLEISASSKDSLVNHEIKSFIKKEEAEKYYTQISKKWLQTQMEEKGILDKEMFLDNNLMEDIDSDGYKLMHFCYEDGEEKVFNLEEHTV